ncbi:hypothetical protein ADEAN_000938900 [Angomonas deanei]|uniref:Uncharacterized protein n=1 Tax=Angomonas deanei TaxID=59799 RepID=A0A7G2CS98_9TRYP|nr:hypothetical protein ADEAN_000938900 [Angomonas deanei]
MVLTTGLPFRWTLRQPEDEPAVPYQVHLVYSPGQTNAAESEFCLPESDAATFGTIEMITGVSGEEGVVLVQIVDSSGEMILNLPVPVQSGVSFPLKLQFFPTNRVRIVTSSESPTGVQVSGTVGFDFPPTTSQKKKVDKWMSQFGVANHVPESEDIPDLIYAFVKGSETES